MDDINNFVSEGGNAIFLKIPGKQEKELVLTLHLLLTESIIFRKNQLKIFHKVYGTVYCI